MEARSSRSCGEITSTLKCLARRFRSSFEMCVESGGRFSGGWVRAASRERPLVRRKL